MCTFSQTLLEQPSEAPSVPTLSDSFEDPHFEHANFVALGSSTFEEGESILISDLPAVFVLFVLIVTVGIHTAPI